MKHVRYLGRALRWLAIVVVGSTLIGAIPAQAQQAEAADSPPRILVVTPLTPDHLRLSSSYGGNYGSPQAAAARRHLAEGIARRHGFKLVDEWPLPLVELDCFVMAISDGRSVDEAVRQVTGDPLVTFAEPMHQFHGKGDPPAYNDPLFRAQPAASAWRLADLHQLSTGRNVTVAVVDSGVDKDHPDLAGQVSLSRNFVADHAPVAEQHGTGIAGIIAAKAGNGIGVVGIAPGAKLMALRACWQQSGSSETTCDTLSLAKALHFAIDNKAQVINLSLAGPADLLLARLLDVALSRGTSVIAAFDPQLPHGGFPASLDGVIAVSDEALAALPPNVYIAPGRDVPTTQAGGRWYLVNGSSYAAAHVSGLLALLRAERGAGTSRPVLIASPGSGHAIDPCASLLHLSGPCDCACARAPKTVAQMRR